MDFIKFSFILIGLKLVVTYAILLFLFTTSDLLEELNKTFTSLVPKKSNTESIHDYSPISL